MKKVRKALMRILAVCLSVWMTVSAMPMLPVQAEEPDEPVIIVKSEEESTEESTEDSIDIEEDSEEISEAVSEEDSEQEAVSEAEEHIEESLSEDEESMTEEDNGSSESEDDLEIVLNDRIIYTELEPVDFSAVNSFYSDYSFYLSEAERNFYSESDNSYDSRDYSYISSVRNQGTYGTCWAHAAIACVESNILKKGLYVDSSTLNLSEQHTAYFTYNSQNDPLGLTEGDYLMPNYAKAASESDRNFLNFGGDAGYAAVFLVNWEGPVDETVAPYQKDYTTVTDLDSSLAYTNTAYHVQGVYSASMKDITAVKKLVVEYGAVASSYRHMNITGNNYYYYKDKKSYFYSKSENGTNHAITIVGWDDNYSASNFSGLDGKKPSQNGAWIIKNSWGTGALDKGYFYISYDEGSMYLGATAYAFDVEAADNYDNNYHYDGLPSVFSTRSTARKEYANIFTACASEKELVEAVNVCFRNTNTKYTVNVYKGGVAPGKASIQSGDMGTLVCSVSGTAPYAGYYTIELPEDKKFEVEKGENYAVGVVVESNVNFPYVIGYGNESENYYLYYNQSANASYSRVAGASKWDILNNADFCIKAYTSNVQVEFDHVEAKTIDYDSYEVTWNRVGGINSYEIYVRPFDAEEGEAVLVETVPSEKGKKEYSVILSGEEGAGYRVFIKAKNDRHEIKSNDVIVTMPKRKALKAVTEPTVTLKAGQQLKEGTLEGALYAETDNENNQYTLKDGIFTWKEPEQLYTIGGETTAEYTFRHTSDAFKSLTGTAKVIVEKVKPEISVEEANIEESENQSEIILFVNISNPYNEQMTFSTLQWEVKLEDEDQNVIVEPVKGESENETRFSCRIVTGVLDAYKEYTIRVKIASPEYEECEMTQKVLFKKDVDITDVRILNGNGERMEGMSFSFAKGKTINLDAIAVNKLNREIDFADLEGTPKVTWTVSDTQLAAIKSTSQHGAVLTLKKAGTFNITAKISYGQKAYTKTVRILSADPSVRLSTEKLTLNLQNTVRGSDSFSAQANHGMSITKIAVTGIKKGNVDIAASSLKVVSSDMGYALKIAEGYSLTKGTYKVKVSFNTPALQFSNTEPLVAINEENLFRFEKTITLNVVDTKPNIKIGKPSINLFYTDGDTQKALVSSTNGKIADIKAVENDKYGFDKYFSFVKDDATGEWMVCLNRTPDGWKEYARSSMSGKINVTVEGYSEPVTKTITIATPTREPSLKQKSVPVVQLYDYQDGEAKIYIPLEIYDSTNKCDLTDFGYSPGYYYIVSQGEKIRLDTKNAGAFITIDKSYSYKNGETLTLYVPITKDNFKTPTKKVTVKAKVYTVSPKVVMPKTTVQFNKNVTFTETAVGKESIKLSAKTDHANIKFDGISKWRIDGYNPSTKKYETIPVSYDGMTGIRSVNGFEMKYDIPNCELVIWSQDIMSFGTGSMKLRIYPMENYPTSYKDITINIIDKAVTATVGVTGSLNLLDRENSYVKISPAIKNSQAVITKVEVAQYKDYFYVVRDEKLNAYILKAKDKKTLVGGIYSVPLNIELAGGMNVKANARVTTKLITPKLTCPSTVTISKYFGTGDMELNFKEYIPEAYKVDKIEVVSISKPVIQAVSDKDKLNIGIIDNSCKNGNYTVKIKIYYHGDDKEAKPVSKNITVKITD